MPQVRNVADGQHNLEKNWDKSKFAHMVVNGSYGGDCNAYALIIWGGPGIENSVLLAVLKPMILAKTKCTLMKLFILIIPNPGF